MEKNTSLGILSFLSLYAPLIIIISLLVSSIFAGALAKGMYFLFWIFIISLFRIYIMYILNNNTFSFIVPEKCFISSPLPFTTPTYSTFILTFTFIYILLPSILLQKQTKIDTTNYVLIMFLLFYIIFDLMVKYTLGCINRNSFGTIISETLGGIGLGSMISFATYNSGIRNNLFLTELTKNNEICMMPSKQKFKCSVYKNGELVGTSMK
jgi:hypothetical protein